MTAINVNGAADVIPSSDGKLTLNIPIQIRRRGGCKRITLPNGEIGKPQKPLEPTAMQLALARGHTIQPQFLDQQRGRTDFHEALEDVPDQLRFLGILDEATVFDIVAQRRDASHPHALLLTGGDLVADALTGDLAFELSEGQQYVQHQSAHAGRGVELLGDGYKGHTLALEHLDHSGEIGKAAGQAVNFVNHDHIDFACLDVGDQAFQSWTLHVAARKCRIVIIVSDRNPALGALTGNIGMTGIALRIDGVIFLIQSWIGILMAVCSLAS